MLGVSERTVRRRWSELGMTLGQLLNYSEIDDDELDVFVQRILHYSPNSCERMVIGALKGYGIKYKEREREYDNLSEEYALLAGNYGII